MAYEVIDEDLKVEACEVGDLTLSQIESFLRSWGDGEKIETLTLFSRQDGTIVLNKNHPGYKAFKDFTLSYLQLEDSEREKLDQPEGIKEAAAVIDRAIEQRRDGCLKQAMKNGLIERNPVGLAELPRQTGKKKERIALTKEQQDLFMEYAKESYLYHFFAVMLQTGMRKGEMQGLKYFDIDKKQNVIHVQRTLKYIEGQGYIEDTPKTRTSTRDIPLTAAVAEYIEAQRKYWNFKVVNMNQYLFCNEEGGPISRERIQAEIDRTVKRILEAGHDFPRITSHVFRHTFATRAIEAGMPPQVLKTILGHSSLAMTMDLYSHVLPDTKAEEMQKIAIMF